MTLKIFCKDQENYQFSGYQLPDSEYQRIYNYIMQNLDEHEHGHNIKE